MKIFAREEFFTKMKLNFALKGPINWKIAPSFIMMESIKTNDIKISNSLLIIKKLIGEVTLSLNSNTFLIRKYLN